MKKILTLVALSFGRREGGKEEETLKDVDNKGERMKGAKNGFSGWRMDFSKGESENNICLYLMKVHTHTNIWYILRSSIPY